MSSAKIYFKILVFNSICVFLSMGGKAQKPVGLNTVLDSIELNNPVSRMYEADIRSMDEAANGARSKAPATTAR